MSTAWVVRSGRSGERDQWALDNGVSGGGWRELPDLSACTTKDAISALVSASFPGGSDGMRANYTGQLWALRHRITAGDLLVMPLKTTKRIAIGRVTKGYHFLGDEVEADRRHVVKVDWLVTDLPRTAVKQDLLFTLGSAMSVFAPSKNHAVRRLEALLKTGIDPGSVAATTTAAPVSTSNDHAQLASVDEPELAADIEQVALDRITGRIAEDFAGHDLATLITAILTAEGYVCVQAPPGPDGGIDITAGRGPLGLDSPRLLTQVKSGSQVGSPIVTQLHGVMTTHGAEQGLLVAWGGLSKPARDVMKNQHLRVRVWEAADVVDAVLRTYSRLPADIRTKLPLKLIWVLGDGDA
ncbi:restriction endonuclease [Nakamurella deserti]|uniref:restriction endonuclease n=1 Tax=Nakamurella deserti TaxID=2164074 RepID=UPI000DBE6BC7|nr:restriction endonuclease [Nakamurella deserti]